MKPLNFFKKKEKKPEFKISNFGSLKLEKDRGGYSWIGLVAIPISKAEVELTIEVEGDNEPSRKKVKSILDLEKNWNSLSNLLFEYIVECFRDSKWEKEKDELEKMYFLLAIDLKREYDEWWIVLEPEFHVPTIFNFYLRFTLRNNEVIWSNIN